MRSINTSLTSLIPIASLLIVGGVILGATPLNDFSLALFIGIAVGTYSSIGVAGPLLAAWKEGEESWTRTRRRLELKETASPRPAGVHTNAARAADGAPALGVGCRAASSPQAEAVNVGLTQCGPGRTLMGWTSKRFVPSSVTCPTSPSRGSFSRT